VRRTKNPSNDSRKRIVFITQQVDRAHPVLAATVPKIAALAERVDEVAVLADGAVPGTLPDNCRVRRFAAPLKAGRGLRFEAALVAELARRPQAVIAHMCPIYAVLAAPVARPLGTRVLLWYTHWKATPTLRLAEKLASDIVSVDARSFPIATAKVVATGHGIDVSEFSCGAGERNSDFRAVALGRYSPSKGLETILRGVRTALDAGLGLRLVVHGPAGSSEERGHRADLERLVEELDLGRHVRLGHAVVRAEIPELFARSDVLVNNMRAGAPDKVVYEACASCLPVIVSNPVFDELLDDIEPALRFEREDPGGLAERLAEVAARPAADRARIGRLLRQRVEERHSVGSWAERILEVALR
jgi:glycosyltransferase involved in cell wall biosynthesis